MVGPLRHLAVLLRRLGDVASAQPLPAVALTAAPHLALVAAVSLAGVTTARASGARVRRVRAAVTGEPYMSRATITGVRSKSTLVPSTKRKPKAIRRIKNGSASSITAAGPSSPVKAAAPTVSLAAAVAELAAEVAVLSTVSTGTSDQCHHECRVCITADGVMGVEARAVGDGRVGPWLAIAAAVPGQLVNPCTVEGLRTSVAEHIRASLHSQLPVAASPPLSIAEVVESFGVVSNTGTNAAGGSGSSSPASTERVKTVTVVEMASPRDGRRMLEAAERVIAAHFPSLRLQLSHSRGEDLQGTLTHTVTTVLREVDTTQPLSDTEVAAQQSFLGEGIGHSYFGALHRSLTEAFRAIGLSPPTAQSMEWGAEPWPRFGSLNAATGAPPPLPSVVSQFTCVVEAACGDACRVSAVDHATPDSTVAITVACGGRALATVVGHRSSALALWRNAVEQAAVAVNAAGAEDARRIVAEQPLVFVLPTCGIALRKVLLRLLSFYCGLTEPDLAVCVAPAAHSTFTCRVVVALPIASDVAAANAVGSTVTHFLLAEASGVGKKDAEDAAVLAAIKSNFPDVFQEQLEYHAEVRAVRTSERAIAGSTPMCPSVSRGLGAQLDWALACRRQLPRIESVQLQPSDAGAYGYRVSRPVWMTRVLFESASGGGAAAPGGIAVDVKKSWSEQRAIAVALAAHFPTECVVAIRHAKDKQLINEDGSAPLPAVVSTAPPPSCMEGRETDHTAATQAGQPSETDPLVAQLANVPRQWIPCAVRPSALGALRQCVQEALAVWCESTGAEYRLHESVDQDRDSVTLLPRYRARLEARPVGRVGDEPVPSNHTSRFQKRGVRSQPLQGDPHGTMRIIGAEAVGPTAIQALYACFAAQIGTAPSTAPPVDGTLRLEVNAERLNEVRAVLSDSLEGISKRVRGPGSALPLESVVDLIMQRYGLSTELRLDMRGSRVVVSLYGMAPLSIPLSRDNDAVAGERLSGNGWELDAANTGAEAVTAGAPYYFLAKGGGATVARAVQRCCHQCVATHFADHVPFPVAAADPGHVATDEDNPIGSHTLMEPSAGSVDVDTVVPPHGAASQRDRLWDALVEHLCSNATGRPPDGERVRLQVQYPERGSSRCVAAACVSSPSGALVTLVSSGEAVNLLTALDHLFATGLASTSLLGSSAPGPSSLLGMQCFSWVPVVSPNTKVAHLSDLCEKCFGLPLRKTMMHMNAQWHCTLSLHLPRSAPTPCGTETAVAELRVILARCKHARKREAIDAAAAAALHHYFPALATTMGIRSAIGADVGGGLVEVSYACPDVPHATGLVG